jgi:hypothetical protein
MKNWLVLWGFALSTLWLPSCKDKTRVDDKNVISTVQVPSVVQSAFSSKYANASEIAWESAHEGTTPTFKVKFKLGDKYWKAEFQKDGTLIKEKEDD